MTMADRIAVMREGRIEQVGTPEDLYERPGTRFVAGFLGDANLFARTDHIVVVRPERMRLVPRDAAAPGNALPGRIAEVVYLGTARKYVVDVREGESVQVRLGAAQDTRGMTAGDEVLVGWEDADAVTVPADGAGVPEHEAVVHA